GDNFLGGLDIDHLIVTELLVPKIMDLTGDPEISEKLTLRNGPYEKLYYILLQKAEECKKELSIQETSEIDFSFELPDKAPLDIYINVKRDELETIIEPIIEKSIDLIRQLFERNNFSDSQIREVILIGGSTLIPLVRKKLASNFSMALNHEV